MVEAVRRTMRERIARGATLDEIDVLIRMSRGLREHERASLWADAWAYQPDPRRSAQVRSFMRSRASSALH